MDSFVLTTPTSLLPSLIYAGALLWLWFLVCLDWRKRSTRLPLPPGPRPKPFIGNTNDMPSKDGWEIFEEWGKKYGDVVYANIFGGHIIYLSSFEAAWDLLEKRSSIYSDRPSYTMLSELVGGNWNFGFMPYGDYWRAHRKIFHQKFNSTKASDIHDVVLRHTRALLLKLKFQPERLFDHIMHMPCSVIFETIYGLKIRPDNDPFVKITDTAMSNFVAAAAPGAFLVDIIPILKYVPAWLPGAGFKRIAKVWRKSLEAMGEVPFMAAKKNYEDGQSHASFLCEWLDKLSHETDQRERSAFENILSNVCATTYAAGFETTTSTIQTFCLAMVLHPHIQQKAHEELDSVIGPDRLPEFSDRPHLPYIQAICKEILRWRPVVPLGIPHRVTEEDVYKGMRIPKGSEIVVNQWAILHDEKTFGANPLEFNPDRFLRPGIKDPIAAFGFGRRICPGRHMAEDTLFIAIASILHLFDLNKAKDEFGNDIPVVEKFTCALTVHPEPFGCKPEVRSSAAEELLKSIGDS